MKTFDTAVAYQQSAAFGASAVGQVVALYDRILRDLRQAVQCVEAGQVENRVQALNHALTIIGELQGVLDYERGGEAATNLNNFYNVARAMILKASLANSAATLQEVAGMFTRLRGAWAQVERNVGQNEPTQSLRISSQPQVGFSQNLPTAAEPSQVAGRSGWSA